MSKIEWEHVTAGVIIGFALFLMPVLLWYYFTVWKSMQESIEANARMDEFAKRFLGRTLEALRPQPLKAA